MEQDFRIGTRDEPATSLFKFLPQLTEIVDLSVVGYGKLAIRGDHGLLSRRRKIDNGEATMAQADTAIRVAPLAIRSPMSHRVGHFPQEGRGDGLTVQL